MATGNNTIATGSNTMATDNTMAVDSNIMAADTTTDAITPDQAETSIITKLTTTTTHTQLITNPREQSIRKSTCTSTPDPDRDRTRTQTTLRKDRTTIDNTQTDNTPDITEAATTDNSKAPKEAFNATGAKTPATTM
jgi:hypothetical protein